MRPLVKHRANTHSQNGEDGVLAELFRRLGVETGWCVEFGAWDGRHLSNTFALVERGWNAVYIEGEPSRYQDLLRTVKGFPAIHPVEAFVAPEGEFALDALLARTPIPAEFELLSIDIDGDDWHVWRNTTCYRAQVVVIEINSGIPADVEQVPSAERQGASFASTVRLGREKGYVPVCHTGNIIFVREELAARVGVSAKDLERPERLFLDQWVTGRQPGVRAAIGRLLGR
jgi:hypothetical protein